jgi:hypothetical protein
VGVTSIVYEVRQNGSSHKVMMGVVAALHAMVGCWQLRKAPLLDAVHCSLSAFHIFYIPKLHHHNFKLVTVAFPGHSLTAPKANDQHLDSRSIDCFTMTGRGGAARKTLLAPIHFIFSLLQKRNTVSIWLYENLHTRIEGKIRVCPSRLQARCC